MGAKMPPMRPLVEHRPTAALRVTVGKSSDVNEYDVATAHEMNNLPISEKTVRNPGTSSGTSPVARQAKPLTRRLPLRAGLRPTLSIIKMAPK